MGWITNGELGETANLSVLLIEYSGQNRIIPPCIFTPLLAVALKLCRKQLLWQNRQRRILANQLVQRLGPPRKRCVPEREWRAALRLAAIRSGNRTSVRTRLESDVFLKRNLGRHQSTLPYIMQGNFFHRSCPIFLLTDGNSK